MKICFLCNISRNNRKEKLFLKNFKRIISSDISFWIIRIKINLIKFEEILFKSWFNLAFNPSRHAILQWDLRIFRASPNLLLATFGPLFADNK